MSRLEPSSFPKAPLERRAYAFLLDFTAVWIFSSLATGFLQAVVFLALWWGLRVVAVQANQGQSLGTWAFDLKVMDLQLRRLPTVLKLSQREGLVGAAAYLAMVGLNINFLNAVSALLLVAPLAADCGLALGDETFQQALHDRVAGTVVIRTKRGFSLDLRLKRLVYELRKQWRLRQDNRRR
ncbi:MAG: RDD family protein [Cyanobacteriota bacterium]|nr:RDD family protein [Cyanobacteriota bacterium]